VSCFGLFFGPTLPLHPEIIVFFPTARLAAFATTLFQEQLQMRWGMQVMFGRWLIPYPFIMMYVEHGLICGGMPLPWVGRG